MTKIHKTNSGYISLIATQAAGRDWDADFDRSRSDLIYSDDGDGELTVWEFTGDIRDSAKTLGSFDIDISCGNRVAYFEGDTVRVIYTPEEFWIEQDDRDFKPNLEAYPNVVAF